MASLFSPDPPPCECECLVQGVACDALENGETAQVSGGGGGGFEKGTAMFECGVRKSQDTTEAIASVSHLVTTIKNCAASVARINSGDSFIN